MGFTGMSSSNGKSTSNKDDFSFLSSFFGSDTSTNISNPTNTTINNKTLTSNKTQSLDFDYINKSIEDSTKKTLQIGKPTNGTTKTIFDGIKDNNSTTSNINQFNSSGINNKSNINFTTNNSGGSSSTTHSTNNLNKFNFGDGGTTTPNKISTKKSTGLDVFNNLDFGSKGGLDFNNTNNKKDLNVLDSLLNDLPSMNKPSTTWDVNFSDKNGGTSNITTPNNYGLNEDNLDFLKPTTNIPVGNINPQNTNNNKTNNYNFNFDLTKSNTNNNANNNGFNKFNSQTNNKQNQNNQNILNGLLDFK